MPNRPMEWPVVQTFSVANLTEVEATVVMDDLMAGFLAIETAIPCSKSSCWYNTGKDRECTRKPDDITPNNYNCAHYNDVFILLKETNQPTMTSIKILKSRKK